MKALSFNDVCRKCGADIPDDGGCIFTFLCDDCCRLAGHNHSAPKPEAPIENKASIMSKLTSYLTDCIPGTVGAFRRNPDGTLECTGLALADTPMAVARLALGQDPYPPDVVKALVPRPEPILVRAAAATPAKAAHRSDGEV